MALGWPSSTRTRLLLSRRRGSATAASSSRVLKSSPPAKWADGVRFPPEWWWPKRCVSSPNATLHYVQTTLLADPGFAGAPVFDDRGEVVGIAVGEAREGVVFLRIEDVRELLRPLARPG